MRTLKDDSKIDHPSNNELLVLDLETYSPHDIKDFPNYLATAKVRIAGCYSYKYQKYYLIWDDELAFLDKLLQEHKLIVGYNTKSFDVPILQNNGYEMQYKINVDLLRVLINPEKRKSNRKVIIELPTGQSLEAACKSNKLRDICKTLNIPTEKGEIDYHLFEKPKSELTIEQIREIELYLYKYIKATKELFEYFVEYFDCFREDVGPEDVRKFNYIRASLASYSYSSFCHLAGVECTYAENVEAKPFKGAEVLDITEDYAEDVVAFDFASLYPHIIMQCNLITPVEKCGCTLHFTEPFQAGFYPIEGRYCTLKRGKFETILASEVDQRIILKAAKNRKQLPKKIKCNGFYGFSSSPRFEQVYNPTVGPDTCTIGRKCLEYSRDAFNNAGFSVLYGDTDSCFVKLNGKTRADAELVAKQIIKDLQSHMPFPKDTWKMAVDNEISKIWFFGKKNYVYITKQGKLVIKGLSIIKSDASELSQRVLKELKGSIAHRGTIKFPRGYIEEMVDEQIKADIHLVAQKYNVRDAKAYSSPSSLHAQIATVLGEGEHVLIPNSRIGKIGKDKKYCTLEESNDLKVADLILDKVWSELEPFIENI